MTEQPATVIGPATTAASDPAAPNAARAAALQAVAPTEPASSAPPVKSADRPSTTATTVNLAGLALLQVPESLLASAPAVHELDLSRNRLEQLPDWISQFTELRVLNLSGNRLSTLPPPLGALSQLVDLDLSDNLLIELPLELSALSLLTRLNLAGNRHLITPPPEIAAQGAAATLAFLRSIAEVPLDTGVPSEPPQEVRGGSAPAARASSARAALDHLHETATVAPDLISPAVSPPRPPDREQERDPWQPRADSDHEESVRLLAIFSLRTRLSRSVRPMVAATALAACSFKNAAARLRSSATPEASDGKLGELLSAAEEPVGELSDDRAAGAGDKLDRKRLLLAARSRTSRGIALLVVPSLSIVVLVAIMIPPSPTHSGPPQRPAALPTLAGLATLSTLPSVNVNAPTATDQTSGSPKPTVSQPSGSLPTPATQVANSTIAEAIPSVAGSPDSVGVGGYPSFTASFDNVGITAGNATSSGDFDGNHSSFSETALTQAGAAPGAVATLLGCRFTYPDTSAGTVDNTLANGQHIGIHGSSSRMGFLLSGSYGPATGNGTVTYTDGSTQTFNLWTPDWSWTTPPGGGVVAVVTTYRNQPGNTNNGGSKKAAIFAETVTVDATKIIAYIQLPNLGPLTTEPAIHIFDISLC